MQIDCLARRVVSVADLAATSYRWPGGNRHGNGAWRESKHVGRRCAGRRTAWRMGGGPGHRHRLACSRL